MAKIEATYPNIDMLATGKRIRSLRIQNNIKVEELMEYLEFTTPVAIYKWQRGVCLPKVENLWALSRIFHVGIEDILIESTAGISGKE